MYRFIDTVSIDIMSIAGYHHDREPREERTVDRSEARKVRLERRDPASDGPVAVHRRVHFPEIGTDCNNLARKV
jgi:hypothetical protein